MTVVDASLVADAIRATGGPSQAALVQAAPPIAAPELLDLEIASAYRKLVAARTISSPQGEELLGRLRAMPITRHRHLGLLPRIWQLRGTTTAYDAAYIALAEKLGATLLTRDSALANIRAATCKVVVIR